MPAPLVLTPIRWLRRGAGRGISLALWAMDAAAASALVGGLVWLAGAAAAYAWVSGLGTFAAAGLATGAFRLGRGLWRSAVQAQLDSERLKYLMLGSLQGVVIHRDHIPLFANEMYARIFGFDSPEQVLRLGSILDLAAPRSRALLEQRAKSRLAGEPVPAQYEYQGVHRSGRRIWIESFSLRVPWEGGFAIQATAIDITERKLAEEALRLSEVAHRSLFETNRRILEHSPAGIVLLDPGLRIVYENVAIHRIMGIGPEQPSGSVGLALSEAPLFRAAPVASLITKLRQRKRSALETTFTNAQGARLHLSVQAVPIMEEDQLTGAVVLVNDMTDRRLHEEALRKQDVLLKALAVARSYLVSAPDLDDAIAKVLASLGTHLGVDRAVLYLIDAPAPDAPPRAALRQEWCAAGIMPFLDSGTSRERRDLERGFARWMERLRAGQPIHEPIGAMPADERRLFERVGIQACIALPVLRGQACSGFLGLMDHRQDRRWSPPEQEILLAITESLGHCIERRAAQDQVRQNEERFARLTANIPGMVFQCVLRKDGTRGFPYVSPHGLLALGLDGERLKVDGEPMFRIIHPTDRIVFERIFREAARTIEPKRWEGRYFSPGGEQRWAQVLANTSRLGNGDVLWDGLLLDITQRKRMELELLESPERDAMAARSRELSEEWYPALKAIEARLGEAAETAPARGSDPGARLGEALALTRQVLRRIEAPRPDKPPLSPADLLKAVMGTTLRGTSVEYTLDITPDIDRIAADGEAVREILANLLVMALQALPKGGHLAIQAANVKTQGQAAGLASGYYVRITVRDDHKGVDPAVWRELLGHGAAEPTTQGGLATVLQWVTGQKGWLSAQGDPEKGPLFTLYLPAATLSLVPAAGASAPQSAEGGSKRS